MDEDGTPFGRYRLISLIGRGGMGEVWRAHDTDTDRIVAIKVLPATFSDNEDFKHRFRREAHAAARLNTPHVIPIHHYGEIDGRLYVDMRLIEGRDLQAVLAGGPLDPARAVRIIEQVAKALHAAHEVGLLHRDVKPSNILLDRDDFAYLIDFGIARAADETRLTKSGNMIGTFAYIAPERLGTRRDEDARADIYSLACVLCECLTGRPPFDDASMAQLVAAHLNAPPPKPSTTQPDVPAQIDPVIATGMAKDPDHRYTTTVELADAARNAITVPTRTDLRPTDPVRPLRPTLLPSQLHDNRDEDRSGPRHSPAPQSEGAAGREDRLAAFARSEPVAAGFGEAPPKNRTRGIIVGAVLGFAVLAVVAIIIAVAGGNGPFSANDAATSRATAPPLTTTPTGDATSTSTDTDTTSPSAPADVAGLAPFVGRWTAHVGILVIRQNGSGHLAYTDQRACPTCSSADAPTGTVDFTVTSVSNNVATGSVEASSDEQNVAVGANVTAQLVAGSPSGQIVQISMGRLQELPFCDDTSAATGQCGA